MKYDYSAALDRENPSGRWYYRPIVPLDVFGPSGDLRITGLVDSGADYILLSAEIAEAVGVDLATCKKGRTIGIEGTSHPIYETTLDIQVEHLGRITVPVGFLNSLPVPCLLGQEGFFDAYRVKFERDHKVFELTPVRKK